MRPAAPVQELQELARVRRARGLRQKPARDGSGETGVDLGNQGIDTERLALDILRLVRSADEQIAQQESERVDVAARARERPGASLRREVAWCASGRHSGRPAVALVGDTEVGDERRARGSGQDVFGLQVAMHGARFVHGRETGCDPEREHSHLAGIQHSDVAETSTEIAPFREPHHQMELVVRHEDLVDPADVGMLDAPGENCLPAQPLAQLRTARIGTLDRDRQVEQLVVGSVDGSGASLTQLRGDPVSALQQGPFGEIEVRGRDYREILSFVGPIEHRAHLGAQGGVAIDEAVEVGRTLIARKPRRLEDQLLGARMTRVVAHPIPTSPVMSARGMIRRLAPRSQLHQRAASQGTSSERERQGS